MNIIRILILLAIFAPAISAQTIHKANGSPAQPTASQQSLIDEGEKLHDAKKYGEAIVLFKRVLETCPDCVSAIYRAGQSYYALKDQKNALSYLEEATKYKSDLLSDVYRLIGSIVDDRGERDKALEIYGKALKLAPDNPLIHYDIGVTLARVSKFDEAKKSLKKSVELAPAYVSPHYVLAEVYVLTKYRVPSMLAAARVLSLEADTTRSKRAAQIFMSVFQGNIKKDEKTGNLNIFLNMGGPTDEGDFGNLELSLGLSGAVEETEENKGKSDEEKFESSLRSFVAIAGELEMKPNFVKKQYLGFLSEMQKKGHLQTFAYQIMHQNGNKKADAWIAANGSKVIEFAEWARAFRP